MIVIKGIEHYSWLSRFMEHPCLVVDVELGHGAAWRYEALDASVREAFAARFPILAAPHAKCNTTTEFLATVCMAMQREKFELPTEVITSDTQFRFAVVDPHFGGAVAVQLISFLNYIIERPQLRAADISNLLSQLDDRCEPSALDQSSRAMVAEAKKRGIPWFRLSGNIRDIQLGQGHLQRRLRETISDGEFYLGASYAGDKALTCNLLAEMGLPVGRFAVATSAQEVVSVSGAIGYPVVLKPLSSAKGIDVFIGLATPDEVRATAQKMLARMPRILVQSVLPGKDHRLLVVDGRFIAAACREPAFVEGDGKQTIEQLIAQANKDPRRGKHFYKLMNYIIIDDDLRQMVMRQGMSLTSVPAVGVKVMLRLTANIATGGTAIDVTDIIHPDNIRMAERATAIIGIKIAGIDFLTPDITRSWREVGCGICEVNAGVGMRPHWLSNPARDVAGPIFDTVFPPGQNGRIPTAMITGSNGKTTTTRMLDHILRAAGHIVGSTTSDGITINGEMITEGDLTGPAGASVVMRDPMVTAAVLETARGGLLLRGIYLDECDVSALLNIAWEQVGIDGVDTLEDMAKLKCKVLEPARKQVILNAEDEFCLGIAKEFPLHFVTMFAMDVNSPGAVAHRGAGGTVVTLRQEGDQEWIVICDKKGSVDVVAVEDIPATFGGEVRLNVANALAATALAHNMQIAAQVIAAGLRAFNTSLAHSSGRFNILDEFPMPVMFDYAHNPKAIETVLKAITRFRAKGRNICALTTPGNRIDQHIVDCARAVAGQFDFYICFEREEWRRGRPAGDISERLQNALLELGIKKENTLRVLTSESAMSAAASMAGNDDFILVLASEVRAALPEMRQAFRAKEAA